MDRLAFVTTTLQDLPGLDAVFDNHTDDGMWQLLQAYGNLRLCLYRNDSDSGHAGQESVIARDPVRSAPSRDYGAVQIGGVEISRHPPPAAAEWVDPDVG
jgi:hypothetical protein